MKLRWGIIGAGRICMDFSLALGTLEKDKHEISALAARSLEKAQALAAKIHAKKAYGSYKELFEDKEVDVVYIGTINTTHKDLSLLALGHGKHVLCEKPITMNGKELKKVLEFAKEKKLFFMEGCWTRFFPLYRELHGNIQAETFGKPLTVIVSFGVKAISQNLRVMSRDLGGSPLLDIGVYALNFADIVFGEKPQKIIAAGHLMENGIDHTLSITLLYSDKRTAQLLISAGCDLPNTGIIISATGRCTVQSGFWCPTDIEYVIDGEAKSATFPLPDTEFPTCYLNSAGLRYEAMHVREAIMAQQTESTIMNHATSERVMEMVDEIRKQMGIVFDADGCTD